MTSSASGGAAPGSVVVGAAAPGKKACLLEAAARLFDAAAIAAVMRRNNAVEVAGGHVHDGLSPGSAESVAVSRVKSLRARAATLRLSSSLEVNEHDALTALAILQEKAAETS